MTKTVAVTTSIDITQHMTVADTATSLGVSERTVWRYLKSGRLLVVGWEEASEAAKRPAVATQVCQGDDAEIAIEVRAVESLPRDHLLIVGFVKNADPEWLGGRVRVEKDWGHVDYRLATDHRILGGPWGGGGSGPARSTFLMVFAPWGSGGRTTLSKAAGTLTLRAWGLWASYSDDEGTFKEDDLLVNLRLPVPEGPPLVHKLIEELGLE